MSSEARDGRETQAVVIGSGFAGLAAALRLARAGQTVTLLDHLGRVGGKAALGFSDFSSGPTVVTMPPVFRGLHERLGWAAPDLTPARPTTTYHARSGRRFAPAALAVERAGGEDLAQTFAQLSAPEARRYGELLLSARQLYRDAEDTFLFAPPPGPAGLARYALRAGHRASPQRSLARHVQSGPFLTPFWLRFATYLGANPYRAPAVLHNIAWVELGGGVWHLRGGLLALAQRMGEEALALGVRHRPGVSVRGLEVSGGRVRAACISGTFGSSGEGAAERVTGERWVSAVDRAYTAQWLLGGRRIRVPPRGVSGFALQLRLEGDWGQGHHIFWPREYAREWRDIAAGRWPADPTLYLHLDGPRAFLLVNAPPLGSPEPPPSPQVTQDYARFLLGALQARFPLPVTEWRALSPAEYARTARGGALYGAAPHGLLGSLRPGWSWPGLGNLVQVGGTVHPGGGVPLSLLSGWNGAGQLLGEAYDDLGGRGLGE